MRSALLAAGVLFCGVFLFMTLTVIADSGFDVFTFAALVIIVMIAGGLVGAFRNPPPPPPPDDQ